MDNAHEFKHIYDRLGIDLRELGCFMLDIESPVLGDVDGGLEYASPDPKKFWINGLLTSWHVTVKYGFLPGIVREDINEVIANKPFPSELDIIGTEIFLSPYKDEQYECLVALVDNEQLRNLNLSLGMLPNINTFTIYKPHITIGYFYKDCAGTIQLKDSVKTLQFNYGDKL